jgi:hypothetical protein
MGRSPKQGQTRCDFVIVWRWALIAPNATIIASDTMMVLKDPQ